MDEKNELKNWESSFLQPNNGYLSNSSHLLSLPLARKKKGRKIEKVRYE